MDTTYPREFRRNRTTTGMYGLAAALFTSAGMFFAVGHNFLLAFIWLGAGGVWFTNFFWGMDVPLVLIKEHEIIVAVGIARKKTVQWGQIHCIIRRSKGKLALILDDWEDVTIHLKAISSDERYALIDALEHGSGCEIIDRSGG